MRFDQWRSWGLFIIAIGWSVTVMAADRLSDGLLSLPWVQIGLGSVLAMWGGLTHTLQRSATAKRAGQNFSMGHELREAVGVSAFVGFLTFMVGALRAWDAPTTGLAVAFAGWMGNRALALAEDRLSAIMDRLGQK